MAEEYAMEQLLEDIQFPKDLAGIIMRLRSPAVSAAGPHVKGLLSKEGAFENYTALAGALGEDPDHMKMLAVQLEAARMCRAEYDAMNIEPVIYADTMLYFTRALSDSVKKYGHYVFDSSWWSYRQLNMSIFRISELEFEMGGYEGEKVINIHIPSDACIRKGRVLVSVEGCISFCRNHFPEYSGAAFMCHSWLLSPRLKGILKEGSNILDFQSLFDIRDLPDDRHFYGWVFDSDESTPVGNLREETSLQRGVKALLLSGGNLGAGLGTMKRQVLSGL